MATFEELGTGLTIALIVINLFLTGFGGQVLSPSLNKFVPDQNITSNSVTNLQYTINSNGYAVPTPSQLTNNNDPFAQEASLITGDTVTFIQGLLFGITIFAIKAGAPQGWLLGIIIPLNIIMILYIVNVVFQKIFFHGS